MKCVESVGLSFNLGVTPEKAKIIACEENKKLKAELETAMQELKISIEESAAESQKHAKEQAAKEATAPAPVPSSPLLVNAMSNSSASFELDEALKSKIEQLTKELKDHQLTNIENEEQIQMMNKRISAMEGGNAGVLGLIERINEVLKY